IVWLLTPCFLATSGTDFSSASRRMVTICSSVNRVFFMRSSWVEGAILSGFSWSEKPRAGQVQTAGSGKREAGSGKPAAGCRPRAAGRRKRAAGSGQRLRSGCLQMRNQRLQRLRVGGIGLGERLQVIGLADLGFLPVAVERARLVRGVDTV